MTCPQCGKKMICIDSRERNDWTIRRRHECRCGNRVTTIEQIVEVKRQGGRNGWTIELSRIT